jgi:hypothetical protein
MEGIQDEGNQTKHVKVHGARRVPAPDKNKQTDEQIEKSKNAFIVFNGSGLCGGRSYQRSFKFLAMTKEFVTDLGPQSRAPKALGDLNLRLDRKAIDGHKHIAGADAGVSGRRIRG